MSQQETAVPITDRVWEVPTGDPRQSRYLEIVREWWSQADDHTSVVLLVAPINTFDGDAGQHGDYALYIGSPPPELVGVANSLAHTQREAARYAMADWVARNGEKLTEREADGFGAISPAPNGIAVDWRD